MNTWNQETKDKFIDIMQDHQDCDRLIQGDWFNHLTGRGCFFGCAMQTEDDPLEKAIEEMHLPAWLVYLADSIFEGLAKEEALTFPVELCEAIPVDTSIESVKHKLAIRRLTALIKDDNGDVVNNAIKGVIACHEDPENADWEKAKSAAKSAADSAESTAKTETTAWSAAWLVKWSVSWSVRSSALSVDSVQMSAKLSTLSISRSTVVEESEVFSAAKVAESAGWSIEKTNLIELLKEA